MVWVCWTLTPDAPCAVETGGLDKGCYLADISREMRPPNKAVLCPWICLLHPGQTKGKQHAAPTNTEGRRQTGACLQEVGSGTGP